MGVERQIPRFDAVLATDVCGNKDVVMRERVDGLFVRHEDHLERIADLAAEVERLQGKWKLLPDEQAWWWHWTAEDLAIPFIHHVQKSGTNGRYFIDYPDSRWCDEIGGFWLKVQYPNVPSRAEQSELKRTDQQLQPKGEQL